MREVRRKWVTIVQDMGEWGTLGGAVNRISDSRRLYIEHLRKVHDDDYMFRMALADELEPGPDEIERMLFEAEMLANYGVV